jgi:uncharacterized protein (DUF58 family)
MHAQHYGNHRQLVIGFHIISSFAIGTLFICSLVNLFNSIHGHANVYAASLICLIALIFLLLYSYIRSFPLKAQDRAIRAEENLRHYVLAGKLLDHRLEINQIIALRFASDEEFVELAKKAVVEGLNNDAIKRAIKNWRADHYRA